MNEVEVNKKISLATKWSILTELFAKLFAPISSIILARILAPEAYGIIATMTMVIAFCNLFSDAGFQKYLLQASFKDEVDKYKSIDVAFWTNLIISVILYIFIFLFKESICKYIGAKGLELPLLIACLIIPISSFSSLQKALFKRDLDFKTLFVARILALVIPLFITIPLAFYTRDFWALILGSLALNLINSIYLTIKSPWKPSLYYSLKRLKQMFSFGIWVTMESILSWLSSYLDIFLIGIYLSSYYLGLYKTSIVLVAQIFSLIISAFIPVLTPSLSKFKSNKKEFDILFFKYQKLLSILSIPLGTIILMNSNFLTRIFLGNQWLEAANFIGLWAFINGFTLLFIQFKSAALVAIGKPKYLVYGQIIYLLIFIPSIIISVKNGYESLYTVRTLIRLIPLTISVVFLIYIIKLKFNSIIKNILPAICSSIIIFLFFKFTNTYNITNVFISFIRIIVSLMLGIFVLMFFKEERSYVKYYWSKATSFKIKL